MTNEAKPLAPAAPPALGIPQRHPLIRFWETAGMLLVLVLIMAGCSIFIPHFATQINMGNLGLRVSTIGVVACGMLFCLAAGDFDLSVGSVLALSGVVASNVVNHTGSVFIGCAAGILAGAAVGCFNGFFIAVVGINALIATLATMQIARGLAYKGTVLGKLTSVDNSGFYLLGASGTPAFDLPLGFFTLHVISIQTPVLIMIGCFILFGLLLNKTTFGRNTLAIGGNKEAARLAGIAVTRTKVIIFTLQGMIAGVAGVILASQLQGGDPASGKGLELDVISACVLGGVSLTGGVGGMIAVVIGVVIMGVMQNAMALKGTDSYDQLIVSGSILLAAVTIDRFKQRRG